MAESHAQSSLAAQVVSDARRLHTGGGLVEHFADLNSQVVSFPHAVASNLAAQHVSLAQMPIAESYPQVVSLRQSSFLPIKVGHLSPLITFGPHVFAVALNSHEYAVLAEHHFWSPSLGIIPGHLS